MFTIQFNPTSCVQVKLPGALRILNEEDMWMKTLVEKFHKVEVDWVSMILFTVCRTTPPSTIYLSRGICAAVS